VRLLERCGKGARDSGTEASNRHGDSQGSQVLPT
jgi:hypothetical protein